MSKKSNNLYNNNKNHIINNDHRAHKKSVIYNLTHYKAHKNMTPNSQTDQTTKRLFIDNQTTTNFS